MKKALIYTLGEGYVGGFADRITGMASLFSIAQRFDLEFYIDFKKPFDFLSVFSNDKKAIFDWNPALTDSYGPKYTVNLVDQNFEANIDVFLKTAHSESFSILVQINNIKPIFFNKTTGLFSTENSPSGDSLKVIDATPQEMLHEFGKHFLQPEYSKFNEEFHRHRDFLLKNKCIGLAIRVGGNSSGWTDPNFSVPSIDTILDELSKIKNTFDHILITSDNLEYKKMLIEKLSPVFNVFWYDETPTHLERSEQNAFNFVDTAIGDHCLLRLCEAGVMTAGGGYGRSAAWLAGTPVYSLPGKQLGIV